MLFQSPKKRCLKTLCNKNWNFDLNLKWLRDCIIKKKNLTVNNFMNKKVPRRTHTWATEFLRVWVRVGYPQLTIYPRQLKNSGVQPTLHPRQPKYSGTQPTIYPTTDFLKHLILPYSFEIKQINERTNIYLKFYFKIMFLSHNNVFFIIKSKSKILINSLKSAYLS